MHMDNFSNFILESRQPNTLFIFDLDDTLVSSPHFEKLAIEYLTEKVTIKSLLNKVNKQIGVSTDDLKWEHGRIYVPDPDQKIEVRGNWVRKKGRVYLVAPESYYFTEMSLPVKTKELSVLYQQVENKAIVTGRIDVMRSKLMKRIDELGLDQPNFGFHCYPKSDCNGDKVAFWKAKTVVKMIDDTKFRNVRFFDDNSKWVRKVDSAVRQEFPDLNWDAVVVRK